MKKLMLIFLFPLLTGAIKAQNAFLKTPPPNFKNSAETEPVLITGINGSPSTINNVNVKAVRDFVKSCKKAESIHWYPDTKGTFVYYYINGNKGRRFYDTKGDFVYNILSYPEEFLETDIRKLVKSIYYMDYTITWVNEIQTGDKTSFIVHLSDKTSWKTIMVCEGEIEVLEEFKKAD